jgi:small subunit ribosomal protein S6
MSEIRTNTYEALFLFPQSASAELSAAVEHINEILGRAQADVIALRKWDERRLAYDVKGNKRGVYFLAYFKAQTSAIVGIERDCRLSERLLRSMITKANHIPAEEIASQDGRQQLADEMRLRDSGAPAAETAVGAES